MRSFRVDHEIYTNREFFVAQITAVGDKGPDEENYPCSWVIYSYTDDMAALDERVTSPIYGDYTISHNTAYPMNEQQPVVGSNVLMRFRGTREAKFNIFEFIQNTNNPSLAMTALQCSGGLLSATYSDGCVKQ